MPGADGIHSTMLTTLELPPGYSTVKWLQQLAPGSPDTDSLALLGWATADSAEPDRCPPTILVVHLCIAAAMGRLALACQLNAAAVSCKDGLCDMNSNFDS